MIGPATLLTDVPRARPDETVGSALFRIRSQKPNSINYVYVLEGEKLIGIIPMKQLLYAENTTLLQDLMRRDFVALHPGDLERTAASLAIEHNIKAVPIVEPTTLTFLGVISADQILSILHEQHIERTLRMSGIIRMEPVTDIFSARLGTLVRLRLPWLLIGLAGGMLATLLVELFEETLAAQLSLAFFIPVIVYMSDAVGTQTETLFIRNFLLRRVPLKSYIPKEFGVGLAIGAICAALMFLFALAFFGNSAVAWTVGLATFASITIATVIAILIPSIFIRFGKDPAFGSGPFATVIQDVLSLLIYFSIASLIFFT